MNSKRTAVLQVLMNGHLVGRLSNSTRGVLSFDYDQSWLEFERRRPISLSMPLAGNGYSGLIVENYFDNLLPDSQPIRNRLLARVGAESGRCFDLLARIGRDCIGALQLLPEGENVDQLTPLYDVISVHPLASARQIDRQQITMAMAVHGKNRHYRWDMISRRHWLDAARKCRFSPDIMDLIIDECCDQLAGVIEQVSHDLPPGFSEEIASSIFSGLQDARNRLSVGVDRS